MKIASRGRVMGFGVLTKWAALSAVAVGLTGCSLFEDDEETLSGVRIPVRATADEQTTGPELRAQIEAISAQRPETDWPQVNGNAAHIGGHMATDGSLSQIWSADMGSSGGSDGSLTAAPIVAEGRVYTLDGASQVSAFNASSGAVAWRASLAPEGEDGEDGFGGGLAYAAGRIYAATGFGEVIALEAASGSEVWRTKTSAPIRAAPTAGQGVIIAISRDNVAYAFDPEDGGVRWRVSGASSGAGVLGGASAAISPGGTAVLPFGTGEIVAVRANSGRRSWSDVISGGRRGYARSAISDISADPVIQGVAVIAGNSSGLLVAIDGRSGRRGWVREFGAAGPVWTDAQTLYVVTDDAQLKRLSTQDGSTLWSTALPEYDDPEDLEGLIRYGGPVLAGGQLLVTSSEGQLLTFDPMTGAETGFIGVSDLSGIAPVVAGGTVYVVTDGATLIALR